jgi:membrane protease subunit HflK
MTAENATPEEDGTILTNNGPWGSGGGSGGGGGNNPWGQRPSSGDNKGSGNGGNIDDMLRHAQERFRGRGNGGGRRGGAPGTIEPQKALLMGLVVLVLFWLSSGFYRVNPGENAVLMTFGKWTSTRGEPGLGYHLPWPIQQAIKLDVAFDRRIEVGFRGDSRSAVAQESLMLTGDENIIDIKFIVLWRVSDAGKYLFKIVEPEATLKKVAESAMREIVGRTQIQRALTEARGEIEVQTKELMQRILDEYEAGIIINNVQLLQVDPPQQVVEAFNDVQRARADRERLRNEAETYRNDIVPRARGDAQKLLQDGEAYKESVTSRATGDAERFLSIYKAYAQSKDVTQKRIYIETMQEILTKSRKIIVGDDSGGVPVLPYMQLDGGKATAPRQ